tara:strand:+ start:406 stop:681 length:276 start_codon:yes stop_codon:yes gene_type:complete
MDVVVMFFYVHCSVYFSIYIGGKLMKTFRITYTQASENMVEIEAGSAKDAWKQIITGDLDKDNVTLNIEGKIHHKAKVTEEITKHIATNPT